jgi:hypothetical protein
MDFSVTDPHGIHVDLSMLFIEQFLFKSFEHTRYLYKLLFSRVMILIPIHKEKIFNNEMENSQNQFLVLSSDRS